MLGIPMLQRVEDTSQYSGCISLITGCKSD